MAAHGARAMKAGLHSINRHVVMGRVRSRSSLRQTSKGVVLTFQLVTHRPSWPSALGVTSKTTEHHQVVVFGELSRQVAPVRAGELLYVSGPVVSRTYTGPGGSARIMREIQAEEVHRVDGAAVPALGSKP